MFVQSLCNVLVEDFQLGIFSSRREFGKYICCYYSSLFKKQVIIAHTIKFPLLCDSLERVKLQEAAVVVVFRSFVLIEEEKKTISSPALKKNHLLFTFIILYGSVIHSDALI